MKLGGLIGTLALFAILTGGCSDNSPAAKQPTPSTEALAMSEMPGPKIGDPAPFGIAAKTQDGETVSLADLSGEKGLVLVFFRSAQWCPYCQAQLKGLNRIADTVAQDGYKLAAISYDEPEILSKFAAAQDIKYDLMSDEGSRIIDSFGLRDPQYTEGRAVGVPYASIFIISPDGIVRAKTVSSDYKVRPSNPEVMALLNTSS